MTHVQHNFLRTETAVNMKLKTGMKLYFLSTESVVELTVSRLNSDMLCI